MGLRVSRGDSLDRYYLLKALGMGSFVHYIHDSDAEGVYHSHPWSGLSIIFGSYEESFQDEPDVWHKRWFFNIVKAGRHHNVRVTKPVWSLFLHLPKSNQWEIIDGSGAKVTAPWEGDKGHKSYTAALAK